MFLDSHERVKSRNPKEFCHGKKPSLDGLEEFKDSWTTNSLRWKNAQKKGL